MQDVVRNSGTLRAFRRAMDALLPADASAWLRIFAPSIPLIETVLRGTVMFLGLFVIMRLTRRESSGLSLADVLLVTLLGDAAQNAMAGESTSVADGAVLVATIIGWERAIDWLGWRSARIRHWLKPAPLPLVLAGRIQRHNLRREWITVDELMSQLRLGGIDDLEEVKSCTLEPDGSISVVKAE